MSEALLICSLVSHISFALELRIYFTVLVSYKLWLIVSSKIKAKAFKAHFSEFSQPAQCTQKQFSCTRFIMLHR